MPLEEVGKITSVSLGGIDGPKSVLTFWINFEFGGSGQGFGGNVLATDKQGWGGWLVFLSKLLEMLDCGDYNKLPGQVVRVRRDKPEWHGSIIGIGHPYKDQWVILSDYEIKAKGRP